MAQHVTGPGGVPTRSRTSSTSHDVVIVGAGLGGLAAACHLAGGGRRVTVLERSDQPGGKAGRLMLGGYRFDTGPTVLTMPGLVRDTLAAAGADPNGLAMTRVDPAYRATYPDGSEIVVRAGHEPLRAEIARVCGPAEAAAFDRFAAWLSDLYQVEFEPFVNAYHPWPWSLLGERVKLAKLARLGGFGSWYGAVSRHFADERLRQLFSFQALYAGVSPFDARALFAIIAHLDTAQGVWFPDGGMFGVSRALADAAIAAGAELRVGATVAAVESGPTVVLEDGERLDAAAVIVNADALTAYRTLLGVAPPRLLARGRYAPSCLLWHLGVRGDMPGGVAHHNLHVGGEWRRAFNQLIDQGEPMDDPSLLVSVPTITDPTAAPAGGQVIYALEPVPNLDRARRPLDAAAAKDRLARRLDALGYPLDRVEASVLVTPSDWAAAGCAAGTPFSLAHTFGQSGPFRGKLTDRRLPGVVFAGAASQPGVGVPMVLISGRLAAAQVDRILAGSPRSRPALVR